MEGVNAGWHNNVIFSKEESQEIDSVRALKRLAELIINSMDLEQFL